MRKQIHPLILFSFFGIMMFILIINRPLNDSQSFKTKSNIAQIEAQALKHLDKPIIDLSGWQRPEEINYDALSQNISGAIVRVHSGAQTTKENDASLMPSHKIFQVLLFVFTVVLKQQKKMMLHLSME
ncbi:lysozyme [Streptococcus pneumoniae]|nr:lysozyme [Streptococcus pneumoniae]CWF51034.1 lysozyme [Streptococcus pneumoniae]